MDDMVVTDKAVLKVDGYDPITIDLYGEEAPKTVERFIELAKSGYYDGLALYRIDSGFVVQGGTKGNTSTGNDASISELEGEFSSNGHDNALADNFDTGVVAMARSSSPNSAKTTFFITLGSADQVGQYLDGAYAAFGTIDAAGMKTVGDIVSDYSQYATGDMGSIPDEDHMPIIQSITIEKA